MGTIWRWTHVLLPIQSIAQHEDFQSAQHVQMWICWEVCPYEISLDKEPKIQGNTVPWGTAGPCYFRFSLTWGYFNSLKKNLLPKKSTKRYLFKTRVTQWQIGLRSSIAVVSVPSSHGGNDKWQLNPLDDAAWIGWDRIVRRTWVCWAL